MNGWNSRKRREERRREEKRKEWKGRDQQNTIRLCFVSWTAMYSGVPIEQLDVVNKMLLVNKQAAKN